MSSRSAAALAWEEWITLVSQNHITNYAYASALTFVAYDIVISFDQEVRYIWGSKWSLVKGLYFMVRYCSILVLIPMVAIFTCVNSGLSEVVFSFDINISTFTLIIRCKNYFFWSIICGPPLFIITLDTIMILRVWAVYNRNRTLLIVLSILILADFIAALWAAIKYSRYLVANVMPMPDPWRGCASTIPRTNCVLLVYVPNFVLSCLFLGMTVWRLVQNQLCGSLSWKNLRKVEVMSPLVAAFIRDGILYFALACIATLLGLITAYNITGGFTAFLYPWIFALYSYTGAHLILNLRAIRAEDGSPTLPGMLISTYSVDCPVSRSVAFA